MQNRDPGFLLHIVCGDCVRPTGVPALRCTAARTACAAPRPGHESGVRRATRFRFSNSGVSDSAFVHAAVRAAVRDPAPCCGLGAVQPRPVRGRAGRRGPGADKFTQSAQTSARTHGLRNLATPEHDRHSSERRSCRVFRKSAEPSASRTRCWRLAPERPRRGVALLPAVLGTPGACPRPMRVGRRRSPGSLWRAACAPGTLQLGPPTWARASREPNPATASRLACRDARERPSGEAGRTHHTAVRTDRG
jgi:hypothetical protein